MAAARDERKVLRIGDVVERVASRRQASAEAGTWRIVRLAARDHHTSRTIAVRYSSPRSICAALKSRHGSQLYIGWRLAAVNDLK